MTHLFLYALALFFLSQSAALAKYAAVAPEIIGTWRLLLAFLFFLVLATLKKQLKNLFHLQKSILPSLFLAGVFFFLHLWTFFYASQNTLISHTMILFCLNPLFVAFGSWWMHRTLPSKKLQLAYLFSLMALLLLMHETHHTTNQTSSLLGDLSAFLSAGFFAVYLLLSQKCRKILPNFIFSAGLYFSGFICFFLVMAIQQDNWIHHPNKAWLGILGQVIFSTLLGHSIISYLMKHLDLNWMATGKLSEPLMASAVAYFVFQETVSLQALLAFAFTGASLFLLLISSRNRIAS